MKSKYIPIFSAGLIFLGFVLNQGYYYHFGLNITNYFTTGELILSFLDVSLIFIIVLYWFLYMIYSTISSKKKKLINSEKNKDFPNSEEGVKEKTSSTNIFENVKYLWLNIMFYFFKRGIKPKISFFKALLNIVSWLVIMFFFLGSTYFYIKGYIEKKGNLDSSPLGFFFLCLIWIIIILVHFKKSYDEMSNSELLESEKSNETKPIPLWLFFLVFIPCFSLSLWTYSSFKAFTILENQPKYEFEIKTTDEYYESTEDLIFVGQSSNYLFIRELSTEKNIILMTDNVDYFSLKKIQKEKPKP